MGTTDETVTLTSVVDVIVTGLLVAGTIDAIDVITRVRSTRINIPIIVVTACAYNDRIAKAEQVGADAVLLKPCLPDTLLHEVQHAIDAKV